MSKVSSYGAAGRVTIGFSKPYVAKYNENGGVVTFSDPMVLARGVSVSISPNENTDNNFYADNQLAESDAGTFTGGTATLTVDGLLISAERYIMGLPAAGADGWMGVGDNQVIPYVATGYIAKYMCAGQIMYRPEILLKTKYNQIGGEYNTQADEIDWQTQELSLVVMRSDNTNHDWKLLGDDWTTEAEAEAQLLEKIDGDATFAVVQNLIHVTSSFTDNTIAKDGALEAELTADSTYTLGNVIVIMGGADITSTAWDSGTSKVTIADVTGPVTITATATA